MSEENKAKMRRLVDEVWNQGNVTIVDELIASNVINHDPSNPADVVGVNEYKKLVTTYRDAFPDLNFTIHDEIAEGDKVVARWTATGTHKGDLMDIAATGNKIETTGTTTVRLDSGKVAEVWVNRDGLGLLQQLGVMPK